MGQGSAGAFKIAQPTLYVDGHEEESLGTKLKSLLIVETVEGLSRCEATFGNWGESGGQIDFVLFDRKSLDFGKVFQVKRGSAMAFDGRIYALEGLFPEGQAPELVVLAEDRLQDLRMIRRSRTWENVSDADVFQAIAVDHGLEPKIQLEGPTYRVVAQLNQSDLAFLRERARLLGAEVWVEAKSLHAEMRDKRNSGKVTLTMGGTLREFAGLMDLSHQRTAIKLEGWDVAGKEALSLEAGEEAISSELENLISGVSILKEKFGERKDVVVHTGPLSSQEARAQADAYFRMTARRFVVGRGTAEPDDQLRVGSYADIQGVGPLLNGKYYVTEVRLLFDRKHGIRTEFTAERPGIGQQ